MKKVRVKVLCFIRGEIPFGPTPRAMPGYYDGVMNKHGATCITCRDGQLLGVKPGEFKIVKRRS